MLKTINVGFFHSVIFALLSPLAMASGNCEQGLTSLNSLPQGDRLAALDTLEAACNGNGYFAYEKALALAAQGETDAAVALLQPLLKDGSVKPRYPGVLLYTQLILSQGDSQRALQIGRELLAQRPDDKGALNVMARASLLVGDYPAAKSYSVRGLLKQADLSLYPVLILALYKMDDFNGVTRAYAGAMTDSVTELTLFKDPVVATSVSYSFYTQGDIYQASRILNEQIERTPELKNKDEINTYLARLRELSTAYGKKGG